MTDVCASCGRRKATVMPTSRLDVDPYLCYSVRVLSVRPPSLIAVLCSWLRRMFT